MIAELVDFLVRYFDVWYPAALIGSAALILLTLLVMAICDRGGWRNIPEGKVCWGRHGHCAPGEEC